MILNFFSFFHFTYFLFICTYFLLADEVKRQTLLSELLEEKQNNEIRKINQKIDKFRLTEQRPEYRRDYDLYDPDLLKKECPPRVSDTQLCPVSGLQK